MLAYFDLVIEIDLSKGKILNFSFLYSKQKKDMYEPSHNTIRHLFISRMKLRFIFACLVFGYVCLKILQSLLQDNFNLEFLVSFYSFCKNFQSFLIVNQRFMLILKFGLHFSKDPQLHKLLCKNESHNLEELGGFMSFVINT